MYPSLRTNHNIKPTLWSDQDGVIAQYEHHAWKPSEINPNPIGFCHGAHYFLNVPPNDTIIHTYEEMNHQLEFHVITNLIDDEILTTEHAMDKKIWTQNHMPYLNQKDQYHIITVPKWQYAQSFLRRPLRITDILISDYNKDLEPWIHAGGTAVKYLNGLNSQSSFQGPCIQSNWNPTQITQFLIELIQNKQEEINHGR